jgi:hypothetical protein
VKQHVLPLNCCLQALKKHPADRPTVMEMLHHPWVRTYQRRASVLMPQVSRQGTSTQDSSRKTHRARTSASRAYKFQGSLCPVVIVSAADSVSSHRSELPSPLSTTS